MIFCPKCGLQNGNAAKFCVKCRSPLNVTPAIPPQRDLSDALFDGRADSQRGKGRTKIALLAVAGAVVLVAGVTIALVASKGGVSVSGEGSVASAMGAPVLTSSPHMR
jgi:hypothetical protein